MQCFKCNLIESDTTSLLNCDSCDRNIHKKCSGLSASEVKVMELKGKRILKFYCEDCLLGLRQVPKLIKAIDDLKIEVEHLKKELNAPSFSESDIFDELQDRQTRSNNVLFFNLPEQGNDLEQVRQLLQGVIDMSANVSYTGRIGKKNKNGVRCLKVTFSDHQAALSVVRNRSKLKGSKVYVSLDLTPKQRLKEDKIKEDFKNRVSAGEKITLKYVKGTLQIVPSKN